MRCLAPLPRIAVNSAGRHHKLRPRNEGPISLPHCLGPLALGRLLRHPHVLDAESVNAHVTIGISAAVATKQQEPYIGYKANVLYTQARINTIM